MALEAVVYPPEPFTIYGFNKEFCGSGQAAYEFCFPEDEKVLLGILDNNNQDDDNSNNLDLPPSAASVMQHANDHCHQWDPYSSPEADGPAFPPTGPSPQTTTSASGSRRKRRRTRNSKNKEELENQRMTHITVERNRRKQMNEYLAVLRSLMPPSYVQRGDQASIIGGAINFVKELEQLLQSTEARKRTAHQEPESHINSSAHISPFADFFSFPQYTTRATATQSNNQANESVAESVADIEVTMVESHASLKILSKKRPRQLLKLVAGLQTLRLSILHLNVTTSDQIILYSISVKVEEGSHLNTVDEIAAAVNQMLRRIQDEAASLSS